MAAMCPQPIVDREEVTAILIVLGDIKVNIAKIVDLLEEELGGEEPEEDA
jgi:hypothetical protein